MRRLTRRQRIAAVALAAIAGGFLVLDSTGSGLEGAHGGARGALGALYRGTDSVLGPARRLAEALPHATSNRDKVQRLQQENATLQAQLGVNRTDAATAQALARLQVSATSTGHRIVPARVTALGPGQGFDWTVTLDVGSRSGVATDQTVTDGNGLVGRVLHVNGDSSVVLLAADPGSGVGVRDVRTGQLGVATGHGTAGYTLTPLDPAAVPRAGDQLATGPTGGSTYVAGLAVGTVTAVQTSVAGAVTATVRPAVSATSLDLVGVVLTGGTPAGGRPALTPLAGR